VETTFVHNRVACVVAMEASDPMESAEMPEGSRHFGRVSQLEITISDEPSDDFLGRIIQASDLQGASKLVMSVANRCIRAIRNLGVAPHLHEFPSDDSQSPEKLLKRLRAEIRDPQNADEWNDLIPTPKAMGLLYWSFVYSGDDNTSSLKVDRWPDIEEAIQDDLLPFPEDEFRTNALEHLKLKNHRMALLESVIGLEIVLTRYLKEYFSVYKNTPKDRIENFLGPQLGLTTRLSGILDLTLPQDVLKNIDLKKIIEAVKWRNSITHKTGHLPKGLTGKAAEEGIYAVIALTSVLAMHANQATASPAVQEISQYLDETHQITAPSVFILPNHRVFAECVIFEVLQDIEKLNFIAQSFIKVRCQQDPRFTPDKHLFISFFKFPREPIARWYRGKVELIKSE